MPPPDDHDRQWTDEQLRGVYVPSQLIARLKAIGEDYRDVLDIALGSVPVPSGLLTRAKVIPSDTRQNQLIQAVVLPDGLQDRLKPIPSDERLHEQWAVGSGQWSVPKRFAGSQPDVAHPAFWQRVFGKRVFGKGGSPTRWATAAMLMVVVGAAFFAMVSGVFILSDDPVVNRTTDRVDLDADTLVVTPLEVPSAPSENDLWQLPSFREQLLAWIDAARSLEVDWRWPKGIIPPNVPAQDNAGAPDVLEQDNHRLAMPFRHRPDRSMEQAPRPTLRGIVPPPVHEYDLLALARDGVHPFVSPGSHKLLRSISVPLVTATCSYDRALRDLTAGNRPKPASIRTEDFLAAPDYGFELPTSTPLRLYVGGGPSPWAEERQLLHIAVRTREVISHIAAASRENETAGTSLVVVVDPSMHSPGTDCFDLLRTGLAKLTSAMGADDRVTVIAAGIDSTTLWLADVGYEEGDRWQAVAHRLVPQPLVNLSAALEEAAGMLSKAAPNRAKQVLLITGSQREPVRDIEPMGRAIRAIVDRGGRFHAMRLGQLSTGAARLDNLTRLGGGRAYHAVGGADFGHVAIELLASQSARVAEGVHMTITWNRGVVARYRLLGHESDMAGGLLVGPIETDLFVGETASALFEIELQPGHWGLFGTVQLEWRDPATGTLQRLEQPIHGHQFAPTFVEAAPSVQLAALAASAAEILRQSPHTPDRFGVDDALRLADSVHPVLYDNHSLQDLVGMFEAMAKTGE